MTDIVCLRCGKCCKIMDKKGKPIGKNCKHLVRLKSGKTLCRIFKKRLGQKIGYGNFCIMKEKSKFNHPGCPFNILHPENEMIQ